MIDHKFSKDKASKIYHQVGRVSSKITPPDLNFLEFRPVGPQKSLKRAPGRIRGWRPSPPALHRKVEGLDFPEARFRAGGEQIQPWRTS